MLPADIQGGGRSRGGVDGTDVVDVYLALREQDARLARAGEIVRGGTGHYAAPPQAVALSLPILAINKMKDVLAQWGSAAVRLGEVFDDLPALVGAIDLVNVDQRWVEKGKSKWGEGGSGNRGEGEGEGEAGGGANSGERRESTNSCALAYRRAMRE